MGAATNISTVTRAQAFVFAVLAEGGGVATFTVIRSYFNSNNYHRPDEIIKKAIEELRVDGKLVVTEGTPTVYKLAPGVGLK